MPPTLLAAVVYAAELTALRTTKLAASIKLQFDLLVQRTDLSTEEEILILLHHAGQSGFTRKELGIHAKRAASSITTTLQKLGSPAIRQIVFVDGCYRLTDLGSKRVREELGPKLFLQ
jgi:hypothetical protein